MNKLHILTPVKDSFETTLRTIDSIMNSKINVEFDYTVYNDFSTNATTDLLEKASKRLGFTLVNLKEQTMHPSPNYLMILQIAQQGANFDNAHLLIVESDVIVKKDTVQCLYNSASELDKPGLIAAVTTDINGKINSPYLFAKKFISVNLNSNKSLSFCCTLLTNKFLASYNFDSLNPERAWHDVFLSHKSTELGFKNYLLPLVKVIHLQHSIYPWMHLKKTQPFTYYRNKFIALFYNK